MRPYHRQAYPGYFLKTHQCRRTDRELKVHPDQPSVFLCVLCGDPHLFNAPRPAARRCSQMRGASLRCSSVKAPAAAYSSASAPMEIGTTGRAPSMKSQCARFRQDAGACALFRARSTRSAGRSARRARRTPRRASHASGGRRSWRGARRGDVGGASRAAACPEMMEPFAAGRITFPRRRRCWKQRGRGGRAPAMSAMASDLSGTR